MAITAAEIKFYYSGGASNSNPSLSYGGIKSSVEVGATLHDLFDVVSGAESSAGMTDYRCVFVQNTNSTPLTLTNVAVFIQAQDTDSQFEIAIADEAKNTAVETPANENTAPTGPAFSAPSSYATGLTIPDLTGPSDYFGIWIKRTVAPANSAAAAESATLRVQGDTPA